ncbi:hypothetical protein CAEBREN_04441 [Caenorhabditis brenneri]|uniref:Uncharacterized protein n=1 Tax=Caenorhabditis brenneri TaxID=135651 RepID=G0P1J9_CAEBE|nr:hypothetical protein CAEBREN_04441 [Caenorhabditis brenneri]
MTISVIVKTTQQLLESELSSFFYEQCGKYRETYLLSEIKPMIQRSTVCFLDLIHHKKLAADITENIKTIQTSCVIMEQEVMKSKKHSQRKCITSDSHYTE